jgi:hypothetical protein
MPMYFNTQSNYTIDDADAKSVVMITSDSEKIQITVILIQLADCREQLPVVPMGLTSTC